MLKPAFGNDAMRGTQNFEWSSCLRHRGTPDKDSECSGWSSTSRMAENVEEMQQAIRKGCLLIILDICSIIVVYCLPTNSHGGTLFEKDSCKIHVLFSCLLTHDQRQHCLCVRNSRNRSEMTKNFLFQGYHWWWKQTIWLQPWNKAVKPTGKVILTMTPQKIRQIKRRFCSFDMERIVHKEFFPSSEMEGIPIRSSFLQVRWREFP